MNGRENPQEHHQETESRKGTSEFIVGESKMLITVSEFFDDEKRAHLKGEKFLLQHPDTAEHDLLSELPPAWKLEFDPQLPQIMARADELDRRIILPKYFIQETERKLAPNEPLQPDIDNEEESIWGTTWNTRKTVEKIGLLIERQLGPYLEKPDALLTFFHEIGHAKHPNNQNLPINREERDQYLLLHQKRGETLAQEEYDSWEFAIQKINELEAGGFRFGQAFSSDNVRRSISLPLHTYRVPEEIREKLVALRKSIS